MAPKRERERVSLRGVDPREAMRALLKVDPDSEPAPDDKRTPEKPKPREKP